MTQAHTWSNLELLESGPGRRPLPLEGEKESDSEGEEEQGEVGEQVVPVLSLSNRLIGLAICGRCRPFFDILARLVQHCKFDRKVRNLLAAVGSDDEDEDFGALFSQLARCYFYTVQFTRQSWQGILLPLLKGSYHKKILSPKPHILDSNEVW